MSTRSEQLAAELQHVTDELIAYIEGFPTRRGSARVRPSNARPPFSATSPMATAPSWTSWSGRSPKAGRRHFSLEDLATAAQKNAAQPKAVVLERLRAQAPAASVYVRGLSDAQLQRAAQCPGVGTR